MQPMYIALIAHRFQHLDGQGRVNFEVARGAAAAGHHVTLVTAHCSEDLASLPGVRVVQIGNEKLPTQLLRNLAFARASAVWMRANRRYFDVVQANGFITWESCDIVTAHFVHTAWAASRYFPFNRSLRPSFLYQRLFTWLNSRWERRAFTTATKVIAVSEQVAAEVQNLGLSSRRLEVIHNGVDLDEYHPGPSARSSFHLPSDVPLALFVGDIRTSRKNLGTLLHAMLPIPEMHLAVAGNAEGSPYPAIAKKLGLSERVYFLGKTDQIASLMRSVDLFIFPSRYEAHPLVVLEAMASRLPIVISSTVGSVASFRESFAVLEEPDDVAGLTALLKDVWSDPARRETLAAAAFERARQLSWKNTVDRYMDCYQTFLPATYEIQPGQSEAA